MPDFTLTIGGQNVAGAARPIPVIDPSTGQAFADSPAATVAQLDQAVDAAAQAFASWQHSSHAERSAALERVAAGEYGVCVDCGEDIAQPRLAANPAADRCAECQERSEHTARVAKRTHG